MNLLSLVVTVIAVVGANAAFTKLLFASERVATKAEFERLDSKVDNLAQVTDIRLRSLESDMQLVKAHLIPAAASS